MGVTHAVVLEGTPSPLGNPGRACPTTARETCQTSPCLQVPASWIADTSSAKPTSSPVLSPVVSTARLQLFWGLAELLLLLRPLPASGRSAINSQQPPGREMQLTSPINRHHRRPRR